MPHPLLFCSTHIRESGFISSLGETGRKSTQTQLNLQYVKVQPLHSIWKENIKLESWRGWKREGERRSCDHSWVGLQSGFSSSRLYNDSIHRMMEEKQTRPMVTHMKGSGRAEPYASFQVCEQIIQHCTDLASMLNWKNKHGRLFFFFFVFFPSASCALCHWTQQRITDANWHHKNNSHELNFSWNAQQHWANHVWYADY